jgi:alkanesulfonate monooxygenase SsuD/methylene tetrahydromethanopterin reductase-like flavin-dependent oxidoreductase (luciferase family)
MRFGTVILPEKRWRDSAATWRRAEELGFAHAWTYDHLAWRGFRDEPWFAAIPLLTAVALETSSISIGTLVASPNFRHPLPFAKDLIALDDVSGGRVIAGIGAGGQGWDATMLGQDPWSVRERAERFAEFVELTDLVLREPEATWKGRYYAVDGARTYPGCVQRPRLPLAIAAGGPRSMRVAARLGDYWVTIGDYQKGELDAEAGVALVRTQVAELEEACADVNRDPKTLRRLVLTGPLIDAPLGSKEAFSDAAGRFEEAGVTDLVVHWPRPTSPYQGDESQFESIFANC